MLGVITRFTLAVVLTLCLGLAFTPLGCGGSPRDAAVSHPHGGEGPTVPGATISKLSVCAEQGQHRLKESSYTFQFDVEMTEGGRAGHVKLKDAYPGESGIASCLARALEDMQVPPSCEKKDGGTTQCKRCQQRCEAGDSPSPQCKKCLF